MDGRSESFYSLTPWCEHVELDTFAGHLFAIDDLFRNSENTPSCMID
jgi:hypothetical protein